LPFQSTTIDAAREGVEGHTTYENGPLDRVSASSQRFGPVGRGCFETAGRNIAGSAEPGLTHAGRVRPIEKLARREVLEQQFVAEFLCPVSRSGRVRTLRLIVQPAAWPAPAGRSACRVATGCLRLGDEP
jgi:hypothetical protein